MITDTELQKEARDAERMGDTIRASAVRGLIAARIARRERERAAAFAVLARRAGVAIEPSAAELAP